MARYNDKYFIVHDVTLLGDASSITVNCLTCGSSFGVHVKWVKEHPLSISDSPMCGICKTQMSEEVINDINSKVSSASIL